jgi:hypothetical protein
MNRGRFLANDAIDRLSDEVSVPDVSGVRR